MVGRRVAAIIEETKGGPMHVVMLSLMIALAVCLLLFGLFTRSATAQRLGGPRSIESGR